MAKLHPPEQITLSNGIPVILQHYEGAVAATYWWIKTGSADETPKEAGFAHFLEHMLFKDAAAKESGRASTGKMARAIESLGGDINAYTSFDQTVYHVTCAAQHWERVLDAFGTMAKPQKFLVKDFEREREVILEELRKNEDSPGRRLFQNLFSSTFASHPYGRPVIGYVKTLKAARVSQLEQFYRRNYVSGKMGLVLVGPILDEQGFRRKSVLGYLEKHFGSKVLPKRGAIYPARVKEKEIQSQPRWKVKNFDVKTPSLVVSFRVPELSHSDIPALDLLAGVLGTGELSRLYQKLFYQTSLVTDVSAGLYVPKDPGMLYFQVEIESLEKVTATVSELFKELRRIGEEGPTDEELSRVLVNAESDRLYATQTADGMAGRLGFLKFIMGDLSFDQEYLDDLRAVDSAQVKEVAKKYFDYRRLSGSILVPQSDVQYDVSELDRLASEYLVATNSAPLRLKKTEGLLEEMTLSSGIKVCFYPRPLSHAFSIHASVLGGVRLEIAQPMESADKDWGSSNLMALIWNKGTSTRGAREISGVVEGHAAAIEGFAGRNTVGLQMTGLGRDWNILSDLFGEILVDPIFPNDELDHAKRVVEDSIRSVEDHSSQLCSKLFLETLFEKHPYGRMTHGSLSSLPAISSAKLAQFHRAWVRPERLVISVSGAVKSSALDQWISDLELRFKTLSSIPVSPLSAIDIHSEQSLKAPRWIERPLGREQTHILVGGLGIRMNGEERFGLRLLQTILGGQSGRLFIELREKKSLAYTVSPLSFEGVEDGYVGTYIACSPGKREEAIAGIRQVLETLAKKGPSGQEMKRAQEFYLGRRAMDLQSDSSLAAHYGLESLYGMPRWSDAQLAKKIKAIGPRVIQSMCKKYLVQPHMVTSVVG